MSQLYELRTGQFLDGRRAVLGLALLDLRLGEEIAKDRTLAAIEQELAERGGLQLSSTAHAVAARSRAGSAVGADAPGTAGAGTVPTLEDAPPSWTSSAGQPWRRSSAGASVSGSKDRRAFSVHIDGRWGSGKSSLMNLLARELRARERRRRIAGSS